MILQSAEEFLHVSSAPHDGKVVIVATADDGSLWYSVKQDGFEDSYLAQDPALRTGWEAWQELELPGRRKDHEGQWQDEKPDESVIAKERAELTVPDWGGAYVLRSRYKTFDQSSKNPVQLVSGLGHLYLFRQSLDGTLLVDRFVLDGITNTLVRKLEVRFKRSGQKFTPQQPIGDDKGSGQRKLAVVDSLDFRDANNEPFYEPTTELSAVKNLTNGWFSVVLVPTNDHDVNVWHIFRIQAGHGTDNESVEVVSISTLR